MTTPVKNTQTKAVGTVVNPPAASELLAVSELLPEPVKRRHINEATWRTLCNSIYPGAQSESILMACDYCTARGLDVLKRVVHIVPMNVKDAKTGNKSWRDVIMSGISELRTTATRTGLYAGQDRPTFGPMIEVEALNVGKSGFKVPEWCEVTVHRIVAGERVAFTATVFFDEAMGLTSENTLNSMWSKRPRGQLEKCAEAAALRKAFPEELGGQIAAEEVLGNAASTGVLDTPTQGASKTERLSAALAAKANPSAEQLAREDRDFDEQLSREADAALVAKESASE